MGGSKNWELPIAHQRSFRFQLSVLSNKRQLLIILSDHEQIVLAKLSMNCAAANYILEKSHSCLLTKAPQVSGIGLDDFLLATQIFAKRKQKPLAVKRKQARYQGVFQGVAKSNKEVGIDKGSQMRMYGTFKRAGFAQGVAGHNGP